MRIKSSISAEAKKQAALIARMGKMPKAPKSIPPTMGTSSPEREEIWLMTAPPRRTCSPSTRAGMLACTAGW